MAKVTGVDWRRQLVESLWGLGIPEDKLRAININDPKTWTGTDNINTKDPNDKFFAYITRTLGIKGDVIEQATKMVEWRADEKKPLDERLVSYLKNVMGWKDTGIIDKRARELSAIDSRKPGGQMMDEKSRKRGYADVHIMRALQEVLGPQSYTQAAIKLKTPESLRADVRGSAPEWNPLRTDNPNKSAAPQPPAPGQPAPAPGQPAPGQTPAPAGVTKGKTTPAGGGTTTKPAGTGPAATTTPPPPKLPKTEAEVRTYIDENYPQFAYLQDIPDVWNVVKDAAKRGLSGDRTLGELQKTNWWQKTEADARVWLEEKYQDPATAKAKVEKKAGELQRAAQAAGITIPPAELNALAEDSLRFKWDPAEEKSALGRFFKYDKANLMGEALVTQQTLTQKARDWLVPMDDATLEKWTTQVVNGEVEADYFDGYMKQQAQTLFPQLADPISRGIPPGQWMAPYASVAAQTLGINPDSIDLREAKWMKSINQVGPDGKRTAMNLSDWEDMLKTDETYGWDKTDQGREHGAQLARKMAAMFRGNA